MSAPSADKSWYVYTANQRTGPFPLDAIRQMHRNGQIGASHFLWRPGVAKPEPVTQFPEITSDAAALAPPPAPPMGNPAVARVQQMEEQVPLNADDRSLLIGIKPRAIDARPMPSIRKKSARRNMKQNGHRQGNTARVSLFSWRSAFHARRPAGGGYGLFKLHALGPERFAALLSPIPDLEGPPGWPRCERQRSVGTLHVWLPPGAGQRMHLAASPADGSKIKLKFFHSTRASRHLSNRWTLSFQQSVDYRHDLE